MVNLQEIIDHINDPYWLSDLPKLDPDISFSSLYTDFDIVLTPRGGSGDSMPSLGNEIPGEAGFIIENQSNGMLLVLLSTGHFVELILEGGYCKERHELVPNAEVLEAVKRKFSYLEEDPCHHDHHDYTGPYNNGACSRCGQYPPSVSIDYR